jgi:hypothetical protein
VLTKRPARWIGCYRIRLRLTLPRTAPEHDRQTELVPLHRRTSLAFNRQLPKGFQTLVLQFVSVVPRKDTLDLLMLWRAARAPKAPRGALRSLDQPLLKTDISRVCRHVSNVPNSHRQRHRRSQWQGRSGCHHGFGDARVCCRSNHKRSYRKHSIVRKRIPATAFTAPANFPSIPCVRDNVGCDLITFVQSRIGVGLMEHPANLIKWRTLPLEGEHHELRRI